VDKVDKVNITSTPAVFLFKENGFFITHGRRIKMNLSDEAKQLRNKYYRQYREKNKEHLKRYNQQWRKRNKERIKEYEQNYWENKVSN
jgi:hypothetical protein